MLARRFMFLIIPLAIFVLAACDDSGNANAQAEKAAKQFLQKPNQRFEGIIDGRSSVRLVTVSVKQGEGEKVSGTLILGESQERSSLNLKTDIEIPLEGKFNPYTGVASLMTQSGEKTGEIIIEIAQTKQGALGTFYRTSRAGYKSSMIAKAVFVLPAQAGQRAHIQKTLSALSDRKFDPISGNCPSNVQAWIDAALDIRKTAKYSWENLKTFDVPEFKAAFGKTYDTIDSQGLKKAQGLLSDACVPEDKAKSGQVRQLSLMVADARTYKDMQYRRLEKPIVQEWADRMISLVSSEVALDDLQLTFIQTHWQSFRISSYGHDFRKLKSLLAERRKLNKKRELRLSRLDLMEQYKDRFDLMYITALAQIREYPDTKELVQAKLDEHLVSASSEYVSNARNAEHLKYMISWSTNIDNGMECHLSSSSDCQKISKVFKAGTSEVAAKLAPNMSDRANRELEGKDKTLEDLAQHVKTAESIRFTHRDGLGVGDLSNKWADMTRKRQKLQKALYYKLYDLIAPQDNAKAIVQFEKTYFFEDDLEQWYFRKVDKLLNEKLKTHAPFRGFLAGEYLNALVSKDWTSLRKMDTEYTQGFAPFIAMAGQAMSMINPSAKQGFKELSENMTAVNAAFATYLLEYQNIYAGCLGDDPVEARVSKTTTAITKNEFGFEISRTSWTTEDHYKIPRRLAPHFEQLWGADFREGSPMASDALFNDSRIINLVRGTKNVMKNHPCDHPSMKALEQGMIEYYSRTLR